MINIQVWDQNNVTLIDSSIKKSELGLNPQIDGQLIRLPIPELNEERRVELKKMIKSIGEKCKISIRNIRRDANEELKKLLKSKEIGEDEEKSFEKNVDIEFEINGERYSFLKWGQQAFNNFRIVPPGTGICHQVNLEYLSKVVWSEEFEGQSYLFPDTLVGTDSHTTMVNGLSVLGWGVGGIEAEAGMLGQPISMLIPEVIGFEVKNKMPEGTTATDLVLTVVKMLRDKGVVGKFVEFYGDGLKNLTLADRATIANMAPEYGATCGFSQ